MDEEQERIRQLRGWAVKARTLRDRSFDEGARAALDRVAADFDSEANSLENLRPLPRINL